MLYRYILLLLWVFGSQLGAMAQQALVSGKVVDDTGEPVFSANVVLENSVAGTVTRLDGSFELKVKTIPVKIVFTHVQYLPQTIDVKDTSAELLIILQPNTTELQGVEIMDERMEEGLTGSIRVESKAAQTLPTAFGDFNKLLVTLPGVASNNELSSAYSVRGGNFDENLVYVNDIPVYRPFLSNAGRQEGLSFVNPDMVSSIEFYAGGWEPKYGDKLSSSLNISYKEPDSLEGSVTVGLLGGTIYGGGSSDKVSYLFGARHRDSRYLLNTLEVSGQYFPTYTDFQSLITFDLSGRNSAFINKTKLNWLMAYGRNRYLTQPASQLTDFGSVQQNFRIETAFIGRELLNYDTYQTGIRLTHRFNNRFRTHVIGSGMITFEEESFDVEGAYRLGDVSTRPGEANSLDRNVVVRGIGTNYNYGRNTLKAGLFTFENRYEWLVSRNLVAEAGVGAAIQDIDDKIDQYEFLDSADYITLRDPIFNELTFRAASYFGYLQSTYMSADSVHAILGGARVHYWDYNGQILVSPRVSYRISPKWDQPTYLKFSIGYYQQPPFYRELRDFDGNINPDVRAQRSVHFITGFTRIFYMWNRPFSFRSDAYLKYLYDVIPYDIDNVRIRYFAENEARAYGAGVDFRINGEFIQGTQSWFSLGLLQTREDLASDERGFIRRPTDQRVTLAAYFEDHMPNDPSVRVYLNMVFGSGYPLGPPRNAELRNAFSGDEYYRVDLGLSKAFDLKKLSRFETLWIRAEILNVLAADNTLSYTWIEDFNGNQFAVPNSLSARFLNVKLTAEL